MTKEPIERVRQLCISWPQVTERLSHGEPTWFFRHRLSIATGADRLIGNAYHTIAGRGR